MVYFIDKRVGVRSTTYRDDGGDGRATEASVLSEGSGDREDGREMAGRMVGLSSLLLQLLGLGLGG